MHLVIVLPIILFTIKDRKAETLKIVLVLSLFFITHNFLLYLPLEYSEFKFFNARWNWSGKIYSILGSICFLLLYKKFTLKEYYLTFSQNAVFLKRGFIIITTLFLVQSVLVILFNKPIMEQRNNNLPINHARIW